VTPTPARTTSVETVVETAVYTSDLSAAEAFYAGVLGLSVASREPGLSVFFRVGAASMLLVFDPATTRRSGVLPTHGTTGPGHFALGIRPETLNAWRQHLADRGVAIEKEITWPRGGHSLFFRDPAGNSVELVTPGVWGTPAGW
jgi:catechol 2,3-dioxygenase-like lactoylglutathione lyase family enzyme